MPFKYSVLYYLALPTIQFYWKRHTINNLAFNNHLSFVEALCRMLFCQKKNMAKDK